MSYELYEHFNTTNETKPYFSRHVIYIYDHMDLPPCSQVQTLPYELRCQYVSYDRNCSRGNFLIQYFDVLYCKFKVHSHVGLLLGIASMIFLLFYIFLMTAELVTKYFCPSLKVLAHMLQLSENMAGVTLLAFGNGSSDIFANWDGLGTASNYLYSDLAGANTLVAIMVSSVIMIVAPFKAIPSHVSRDILFFLLNLLTMDLFLNYDNGVVGLTEAILICMIYVSYMAVILIDTYLISRQKKKLLKKVKSGEQSMQDIQRREELIGESVFTIKSKLSYSNFMNDNDVEEMRYINYDAENTANQYLFGQLLSSLTPLNVSDFAKASMFSRIITIFRLPMVFVCSFWVPAINYEKPLHGWSKLLNCLQIIFIPYLMISSSFDHAISFSKWTYANYVLVLSIPLAVFVFCKSRTDIPPIFHRYFAILGVMGSIFVLYLSSQEIRSILNTIGVTTYRSNSFLGCTFLAWGNSVGDIVSNTILAKQGYPRMAFAACFGGPLITSTVVIGRVMLYNTIISVDNMYKVYEGAISLNCRLFSIFATTGLLISLCVTNFTTRRTIGIFMFSQYVLFLIFTLLGEFEIIHTFGSDHSLDKRAEPAWNIFEN